MKHAAEQLIIGKAMTGKNLRDALIGVENIAADMGKAHLVDELQEGDPHAFLKKRQKYSGFSATTAAASCRVTGSV